MQNTLYTWLSSVKYQSLDTLRSPIYISTVTNIVAVINPANRVFVPMGSSVCLFFNLTVLWALQQYDDWAAICLPSHPENGTSHIIQEAGVGGRLFHAL